jgi:hypothetical protein
MREPLPAGRSGSCHVRVTVVIHALEKSRPIVVLFSHTNSVSAYRKVERRPGLGAVTSGTFIRAVWVSAYRASRTVPAMRSSGGRDRQGPG